MFTGILQIANLIMNITQTGSSEKGWFGLEHSAMIVHASNYSIINKEKCVFVEVGAHMGTLAIIAAKLGCFVYAFEGSTKLAKKMYTNVRLNNVQNLVKILPVFLSDKNEERIDHYVKQEITHLKMDIDGMDYIAIQGVDLNKLKHINFEFNPKKIKGGPKNALMYLSYLINHGFKLFLYCCVKEETGLFTNLGLQCMTRGNYLHGLRNGYGNPYIERPQAVILSKCIFGIRKNNICTELLTKQSINAGNIRDFVNLIQNEVDIVGFK